MTPSCKTDIYIYHFNVLTHEPFVHHMKHFDLNSMNKKFITNLGFPLIYFIIMHLTKSGHSYSHFPKKLTLKALKYFPIKHGDQSFFFNFKSS